MGHFVRMNDLKRLNSLKVAGLAKLFDRVRIDVKPASLVDWWPSRRSALRGAPIRQLP